MTNTWHNSLKKTKHCFIFCLKKEKKKKINTLRSKVLAHISPFKHDCAANKTQNRDFMPQTKYHRQSGTPNPG
jgi:hypothetical protein